MGFTIDTANGLGILATLAAVLSLAMLAIAIGGGATYRRYKRRYNTVRDRAKGVPAIAIAALSLARAQSATPKMDRVARRWLPRRDLLAARLARTGRSITIGQYGLMVVGVALVAACGLVYVTPLGILPNVLIGLLAMTSPAYLGQLFHDVRGYVLDGVAVALLVTGVTIMNKMANFEI